MNRQQFENRLHGQTAIAQKVFWVTPIAETWTADQIMAELERQQGKITATKNIVMGCLRALADAKLVKRDGMYHYKRCELPTKRICASNDTKTEPEENNMHAVQSTPAPADPSSLEKVCDRMASAIKHLREDAQTLLENAANLENELLLVMDMAQEREAQLDEFRQLKALMKKIGSGD